ncbi:MAG TPA: hypothetical protein VE439_00245 [Anaerolineae bacterium]|nr:hypothetical protein [Anaerolineae bacterium]
MKKPIFEKSIMFISVSLLAASAYMYLNMDRDRVQLQSPEKALFANVEEQQKPKKDTKSNPYVIWHGSNAMPKGMGQGDEDTPTFMPKWQQDRIKDMRGDPYIGSAQPQSGITPAPAPTPSPTPAPTTAPTPAPSPEQAAPEEGQGITPATSGSIP